MYTIDTMGEKHEIEKKEDLEAVSTKVLVNEYNLLAGKSIKKFSDRATAISRVWELIQGVDVAPKDIPTKSQSTGRKSALNKLAVIRVTADENPKRPGSQAHANFEKYEDGDTIESVQKKGVTLADIRWNLSKGFIELEEPTKDEEAE